VNTTVVADLKWSSAEIHEFSHATIGTLSDRQPSLTFERVKKRLSRVEPLMIGELVVLPSSRKVRVMCARPDRAVIHRPP
jgi:hypothetical protein